MSSTPLQELVISPAWSHDSFPIALHMSVVDWSNVNVQNLRVYLIRTTTEHPTTEVRTLPPRPTRPADTSTSYPGRYSTPELDAYGTCRCRYVRRARRLALRHRASRNSGRLQAASVDIGSSRSTCTRNAGIFILGSGRAICIWSTLRLRSATSSSYVCRVRGECSWGTKARGSTPSTPP
jgi:hypothetical protein